jgi:hypothetical protein
MKLLTLMWLVFCFLLAGLPSTAQTPSPKMTEYHQKSVGFSLRLPADWKVQEDMNYQVYHIPLIAVRPLQGANDDFKENINVMAETVGPSLDLAGYLEASMKAMAKMLDSFKGLKSGDLKDSATNAKYLIYNEKTPSYDGPLKVIVFFYIKAGQGYSLTCTSTEKNFGNYQDLFLQIGRSFKPPAS